MTCKAMESFAFVPVDGIAWPAGGLVAYDTLTHGG